MTKEYKKLSAQSKFSVHQRAHTSPVDIKTTENLPIASHNLYDIRDPLQVISLMNVRNLGQNSMCTRELILVRIRMKTECMEGIHLQVKTASFSKDIFRGSTVQVENAGNL